MTVLIADNSGSPALSTARAADDSLTVLILAKDPILRAGVERQIQAMADVTLLSKTAGRHPDVAVVVADSIDEDVLGWIRTVRKHCLSRILVVASASGQSSSWATEAGATGVLPRQLADGRRLSWAIQKAYRGEGPTVIGPEASSARMSSTGERPGAERAAQAVSERDREVLRLLAEGLDTGEIAHELAYSEPTIKNVIQRLFEQLKAKNRPNLVAVAIRGGII